MIRFLARRIAFGAGVLLVLSAFVFFLFFVAPGDPARMIAGDKATETQLEMIRKNLGVDRPVIVQYGTFLSRALTGDLGFSYRNQQPVAQIIVRRIPATLSLVGEQPFCGSQSACRSASCRRVIRAAFATVWGRHSS